MPFKLHAKLHSFQRLSVPTFFSTVFFWKQSIICVFFIRYCSPKHFSFYFIFIFALKCDRKISIDIYFWKEGKQVGEPSSIKKACITQFAVFSDSTTKQVLYRRQQQQQRFLKNWVWHRKITPLKPFFPFAFLPAIQTYKSGFRKAFWRQRDSRLKRGREMGINYEAILHSKIQSEISSTAIREIRKTRGKLKQCGSPSQTDFYPSFFPMKSRIDCWFFF